MDSLPAGSYKFIQKNGKRDRKSMIFVKLTDSALRGLNDYMKDPKSCDKTPTIEFTENFRGGLIEIPKSSSGIAKTQTSSTQFKFNLESNVAMQGRQGRFECIKRRQGSKKIKKYGLLTKRLKIHANEDVFETTKNRMAEVELEQRKICTKEIDLKLETVNRQTKGERNGKVRAAPLSTSTPEIGSNKAAAQKLARMRNKSLNNSTKLSSPIARRPLKERIIHMLAVRPLKKIEISASLRKGNNREEVNRSFLVDSCIRFQASDKLASVKDGLRDSDKLLVYSTIMSVATTKDNVYHLLRHMWNEVLEDWPFYTEEEREKMLKNKAENVLSIVNGLSTSSTTLSPRSPLLGDRSPLRPGYIKGVDGLPTKRKRISHFNRPTFTPIPLSIRDNEAGHRISPSRVTNGFDDIIEKFGLSNSASKTSPPLKSNSKLCSKLIKSEEPMMDDVHTRVEKSMDWNECDTSDMSIQSVATENNDEISTTPRLSLADRPDFTQIYVTITSMEQRRQYKNDFWAYFSEYKAVNNEVIPVAAEFMQLQKRYRQSEKGSLEQLETEKQIVEKYRELMNTDYAIKRDRHVYLHDLLEHIKKLVHDYDVQMI